MSLISTVLGLLAVIFASVSDWFTRVYTAAGAVELFIASVSVTLLWRYLLKPVIGSAGSDKVSKKDRKKE